MEIKININKLVLHGFKHSDHYLIAAALQSELVRLISRQGLPDAFNQNVEIAQINGGSFDIKPGSKAGTIGSHIGQSIYGGLKR